MKIVEITKEYNIYIVKKEPRLLGRFFGMKPTTKKYKKCIFRKYMFGGNIYYDKLGNQLGINNPISLALDKYDNAF